MLYAGTYVIISIDIVQLNLNSSSPIHSK